MWVDTRNWLTAVLKAPNERLKPIGRDLGERNRSLLPQVQNTDE